MSLSFVPGARIRNPRMVLQVAVFAFGFAVIWVAFALALQSARADQADRVGYAALFLLFAALSALLGVRALRSGVWVTADEVVIRGFCKSHRFPSTEVTGFVADSRSATWPFVTCTGNRKIGVTALSLATWRGRALGADFPSRLAPRATASTPSFSTSDLRLQRVDLRANRTCRTRWRSQGS